MLLINLFSYPSLIWSMFLLIENWFIDGSWSKCFLFSFAIVIVGSFDEQFKSDDDSLYLYFSLLLLLLSKLLKIIFSIFVISSSNLVLVSLNDS